MYPPLLFAAFFRGSYARFLRVNRRVLEDTYEYVRKLRKFFRFDEQKTERKDERVIFWQVDFLTATMASDRSTCSISWHTRSFSSKIKYLYVHRYIISNLLTQLMETDRVRAVAVALLGGDQFGRNPGHLGPEYYNICHIRHFIFRVGR